MTPGFDLQGRVALVTGGSKGLGKAMARGLAEAGADVVIASRHEDELQFALDEILEGTGRRGKYFVADLAVARGGRPPGQARPSRRWAASTSSSTTPAPTSPRPSTPSTTRPGTRCWRLNLSSVMALTRAVVPRDEVAPLGADHPHLVDPGLRLQGEAQHLLGDQVGPARPGPRQRPRPRASSASRSTASRRGRS